MGEIQDQIAASEEQLRGAIEQAEQAIRSLIDAGEQALAEIKDTALNTTIGDAIAMGKAALERLND